jgi:hypothetical protein
MNEIESLLQNDSPDFDEVRRNFTEYLIRVENLLGSCSDSDGSWIAQNKIGIDKFRIKVETFLNINRPVVKNPSRAPESRHSGSVYSSRSGSSAASSSRIRLAERKARLEAEKQHMINIQKIEKEELSLKR